VATVLSSAVTSAAPPELREVAARPEAPDISLPDSEGRPFTLSQLRGKVVLLNFWATWCPPCRAEMPSMQVLWDSLKGPGFELVAVNVGEDEDLVFAFRHELGTTLTFPVVMDKSGTSTRKYPVVGLPTSYVLDKKGRIVYVAEGGRDWTSPAIVNAIKALIAEKN